MKKSKMILIAIPITLIAIAIMVGCFTTAKISTSINMEATNNSYTTTGIQSTSDTPNKRNSSTNGNNQTNYWDSVDVNEGSVAGETIAGENTSPKQTKQKFKNDNDKTADKPNKKNSQKDSSQNQTKKNTSNNKDNKTTAKSDDGWSPMVSPDELNKSGK